MWKLLLNWRVRKVVEALIFLLNLHLLLVSPLSLIIMKESSSFPYGALSWMEVLARQLLMSLVGGLGMYPPHLRYGAVSFSAA